jgi:hypothetical protein
MNGFSNRQYSIRFVPVQSCGFQLLRPGVYQESAAQPYPIFEVYKIEKVKG